MKIAINGFGRIGRTFLRTILKDKHAREKIEVVAINIGPANPEFTGHMFKYDTIMGTYHGDVAMRDSKLLIDDHVIQILAECDPLALPWKNLNIDWVVDASGKFTKREKAELHLKAGAQKVLITAPATDEDASIIPGINLQSYDSKKHTIVSLGSCTTNAFIPMLKVLNDDFGILNGFMTTVHAYTNSQVLLDVESKSLRLSRAAALNIIPTTTGAEKMLGKVIPELGSLIKATSLRVPVGICSLIDLTVNVKKQISADIINQAFVKASQSHLKNILQITDEPLVSSDFKGNSHSVIIDALSTDAVGNTAKVLGWYDNEWGYSERLKDFLLMI
jgi:glyceraldehyde-3-phosphate dehydrogenase type I